MWLQPRYRKKADFFFSLFFPFYFLSCYSQFSNWLHFQSNLPISISPSHPPLNRAALQVSVGLWYLFMINEGEKKKMQMPPTDAKRDKSKSQRRKEGRKGRTEGNGRPLSPEASEARQPSVITHLHTSTRTCKRRRSATHKAVQTRPNLRRGACQKI